MDRLAGTISVLGSVSFGWLHDEGGFAFDRSFFLDPQRRRDQEARMNRFVAERFTDEPIYNIEAHLVQIEGRQRPVALIGGIQPNLILGAVVGGQFVFEADKDPDITPAPLADTHDIDSLANIRWAEAWPISLFLEQIGQMREQCGASCAVIPPFFWDTAGRATTHGLVTTAQKLFGERVFIDMIENPAFAREAFAWIGESYAALIDLFATAADIQVSGLHTGDCSACMVGPDVYAELVVPEMTRLGRAVGPLRLHSCGRSDHLLEVFATLENVSSLNFGSETSVAKVREHFGPMRLDLAPEPKLLTAGTPAQIDAWVRRVVAENGDGRLEFQYHLDRGQPVANCLQITRTLRDLGVVCPRVGVA